MTIPTAFVPKESGALLVGQPTPQAPLDNIQMFDFSVDLLRAILWQYNGATNLQAILQAKYNWYETNQSQFWNNWVANVFNLETANQFGIHIWAIILDLALFINSPAPDVPTFGFDGSASGFVAFDQGILIDQHGSSEFLPLATQRIALQLRYFQLTSSGTVPEINRMLKYVFRNFGKAFLEDHHNMSQTYIFDFPLTWDLLYLFNNYDILPRPAGVNSTFKDATLTYFGFEGSGGLGFDQAILAE